MGRLLLRLFLAVFVVFAFLPSRAGWAMGTRMRQPNIVFILADDLGWADLGCYGNRIFETPNIDGLARSGVRFTEAHVCTVCMPSRVGILTGKNPTRLASLYGATEPCRATPWDSLPPGEVTYAEALAAAGYATGHVGKWGVRHWQDRGERDRGFAWCAFTEDWYFLPNYRYPFFTGENHFLDLAPAEDPGYLVDAMTAKAEAFLTEHRDRPFLLTLSHFAVHTPIANQGKPELAARIRERAKAAGVTVTPDYGAIVESLDASTGRILATLRKLGLEERTVVVFLSDNGGEWNPETPGGLAVTSNAPLRGGKATVYEGGIRVPLIVRWPGTVKPGTVTAALTAVEDVYPTLLGIAGVPVPAKQKIDGVSLVPVLDGSRASVRETMFTQWEGAVARRGPWKLIEYPPYVPTAAEIESGRAKAAKKGKPYTPPEPRRFALELYNLADDLGETHDLSAGQPGIVRDLRRELHAWMKAMVGEAQYSLDRPRADAKAQGQTYPDP
ncbi:MAG: sulfatase [Candidatus Coatesbacteria bacterium]